MAVYLIGDVKPDRLNLPVIHNQDKPLYGNLILELKEEIFFEEPADNMDDRGLIFAGFYSIALNSKGDMVIGTGKRAVAVDKNGRYIKDIGGTGAGPGEYQSVTKIVIDKNDNLYLKDLSRLHIYDKNGNFKKHIILVPRSVSWLPDFCAAPAGDIFCLRTDFDMTDKNRAVFVEMRGNNGELVKQIFSFPDKNYRTISNGMFSMTGHEYMQNQYLTPVNEKEICFGSNLDYKLYFCDFKGNLTRTVEVNGNRQKITSDELAEFKRQDKKNFKEMVFPPHRPFFQGLLSDEKGRIYVIRTKPILEKDKGRTIDIFGMDGRFLYRTFMPCYPRVIRNGAIYFPDRAADERAQIKKLVIQNYSQIKY